MKVFINMALKAICKFMVLSVIVFSMSLTMIYSHQGNEYYTSLFKLIYKLGFLGQLIFLLLYISGSLIAFPAMILDLTLGYLYPFYTALSICLIGSYTGHILTYIIGRFIFKDSVLRLLKSSKYLRLFQYALQTHSWKYLFLIRIIYLPAALKNYGLAALSVPFVPFMTTACMVSGISVIWHILLGSSLNSLIAATHTSNLTDGNIILIFFLLGMSILSFLFILCLTRKVINDQDAADKQEISNKV